VQLLSNVFGGKTKAASQETISLNQPTEDIRRQELNLDKPQSDRRLAVVDLDTGDVIGSYDSSLLIRDNTDEVKYSHSKIKTYNTCSAQTHFRNQKAFAQPQFALERGSAAHRALELGITQGKDPLKVLEDEWTVRFLERIEEYSKKDQDKIHKEYANTQKMIRYFMEENKHWIPRVRPEDNEVEFDMVFDFEVGGRKFKRRLLGYIDQILWDVDHNEYEIIDFKTSAKAPADAELAIDAQFALYQIAATRLYGKPPSAIYYYLLKGDLNCDYRDGGYTCNGDKKHKHVTNVCKKHYHTNKCFNFSFEIPIKTDEEIQTLLNTYHGPNILQMEAGAYSKQRHDLAICGRCMYQQVCNETKELPLPKWVIFDE
jgi:hypothetical protein